jgi:trigger factor
MVKVEVKREPGSRAVLEVEVPQDRVDRAIDASFVHVGQRAKIPGFRPGKAPRAIVERHVRTEAVYERALESLLSEAYREALEATGIRPIARPQIDVGGVVQGKPLRFTLTVEVEPEVKLGAYRDLCVPRENTDTSEEDVERRLEAMRGRYAQLVSKDGAAEPGDFVLVSVQQAPEGMGRLVPGREVLLEVGAADTPADVGQALIGRRRDETVEVGNEQNRVRVTLIDLRVREMPPLDDAFAQMASDKQTLDELRAQIRARLEGEAARAAQRHYEEKVLTALLERSEFDVPETMVQLEVHALLEDLREELRHRGLTFERYLELSGKGAEQVHDEMRPAAERRARARLALDAVAAAESIESSEQDLREEVENLAGGAPEDAERVRSWLQDQTRMAIVRARLRRRRTLAFLTAVASGRQGEGA